MWTIPGSLSRLVRTFSPMLVADDAPLVGSLPRSMPRPEDGAVSALALAIGSPEKARKARDRYVAARFQGVARCSADLRAAAAVVKAARLLFEEDRADLAIELLELAAEEVPGEEALVLARLEILYLMRECDAYVRAAARLRETHPGSKEWPLVERLGRRLAPSEPMFGAPEAEGHGDHYGPWPDLPNWILAPWDLSGEIAAADFHREAIAMATQLPAEERIAMLEAP